MRTAGVLRLLGVPRRRVILSILAEGVLIALAGVVFGVLLAVVSQDGFNRFFQWAVTTRPSSLSGFTAPVIWRSVAYAGAARSGRRRRVRLVVAAT